MPSLPFPSLFHFSRRLLRTNRPPRLAAEQTKQKFGEEAQGSAFKSPELRATHRPPLSDSLLPVFPPHHKPASAPSCCSVGLAATPFVPSALDLATFPAPFARIFLIPKILVVVSLGPLGFGSHVAALLNLFPPGTAQGLLYKVHVQTVSPSLLSP